MNDNKNPHLIDSDFRWDKIKYEVIYCPQCNAKITVDIQQLDRGAIGLILTCYMCSKTFGVKKKSKH